MSGFDTSKVTTFYWTSYGSGMFHNSTSTQTIYVDPNKWSTEAVTNFSGSNYMVYGATGYFTDIADKPTT